jgi:hypothetical protein
LWRIDRPCSGSRPEEGEAHDRYPSISPAELSRFDAPVIAENAGGDRVEYAPALRIGVQQQAIEIVDAREEIRELLGEPQAGRPRPDHDADGGPVAPGPRTAEQAGQAVARDGPVADPDLPAADWNRAVAQEHRPGRVRLGMAVVDHVAIPEFVHPARVEERGVGHDVHRAIAVTPERLGIEPCPGQPPGVLLGRPLGAEVQDEAVAEGLLERPPAMRSLARWRGRRGRRPLAVDARQVEPETAGRGDRREMDKVWPSNSTVSDSTALESGSAWPTSIASRATYVVVPWKRRRAGSSRRCTALGVIDRSMCASVCRTEARKVRGDGWCQGH